METSRNSILGAFAWLLFVATGCGYRAEYGNGEPARVHLKLFRTMVADAIASDEVIAGAREELAREGALVAGDGYPRIEIEVLRADESSEGIASAGRNVAAPAARATDEGIAARAWIVRTAGAPPESDTGDLRAEETISVDEGPRASGFHRLDALRAAARRLGRRLAYKVTGKPAATDEGSQPR